MEAEAIVNNGSEVAELDASDMTAANGITKKDRDVEEKDVNEILDLKRKIGALEVEKSGLLVENMEMKEKIELLNQEIEGYKINQAKTSESLEEMKKEIDRCEEDKAALKVIGPRAAQLEIEVSRLQHDLISAMSASEESAEEIKRMREAMEELKRDKDSMIEKLVKENSSLIEKVERAEELSKKSMSESEFKIRELEEKLYMFERREISTRNQNADIEKEAKSKVSEKEIEIDHLRKENVRIATLEEKLKRSEEKCKETETEMNRSQNELKTMIISKEKNQSEMEVKVMELEEKLKNGTGESAEKAKGLHIQWPTAAAAAASTGTVAAVVAMFYVNYAKRR